VQRSCRSASRRRCAARSCSWSVTTQPQTRSCATCWRRRSGAASTIGAASHVTSGLALTPPRSHAGSYTPLHTEQLLAQLTGQTLTAIEADEGAAGVALAEAMVLEELSATARCCVATIGSGALRCSSACFVWQLAYARAYLSRQGRWQARAPRLAGSAGVICTAASPSGSVRHAPCHRRWAVSLTSVCRSRASRQ
jgi:hypothetical protein